MVKILLDSASDVSAGETNHDYLISIRINFDGEDFRDGVDIDSNTFYKKLVSDGVFPSTSQPSPIEFEEVFSKVKQDGDELVYLAVSSKLSGTYQCAMLAKENVGYDGIYIVDTLNATHAIALLAQHAKCLVNKGLTASEIARECQKLSARLRVVAGVDTLEYLRRGGRLSNVSAAVGEVVKLKPVVAITPNGKVESIGKCLGRAKAIKFVSDWTAKNQPDESFPIWSLYTYGEENCVALEASLKAQGITVNERKQIGPTIGTHCGPGVYGVVFVAKE
ncbi:MAG: DegV family protein [Clostridiales bacterium]|nr:DegV family protein [Clostridiales bacterium]